MDKCICYTEYIFNKHDDFPGVIFEAGKVYELDRSDERFNLMCVTNREPLAHVGMSIETFCKHFIITEGEVKIEELENPLKAAINSVYGLTKEDVSCLV